MVILIFIQLGRKTTTSQPQGNDVLLCESKAANAINFETSCMDDASKRWISNIGWVSISSGFLGYPQHRQVLYEFHMHSCLCFPIFSKYGTCQESRLLFWTPQKLKIGPYKSSFGAFAPHSGIVQPQIDNHGMETTCGNYFHDAPYVTYIVPRYLFTLPFFRFFHIRGA